MLDLYKFKQYQGLGHPLKNKTFPSALVLIWRYSVVYKPYKTNFN